MLRTLKGVHLAFTGILSKRRSEAVRAARRAGAIVHGGPSAKTTVVVRGRPNPLQAAGRDGGLKLMEIKRLREKGHRITLLNETAVLAAGGREGETLIVSAVAGACLKVAPVPNSRWCSATKRGSARTKSVLGIVHAERPFLATIEGRRQPTHRLVGIAQLRPVLREHGRRAAGRARGIAGDGVAQQRIFLAELRRAAAIAIGEAQLIDHFERRSRHQLGLQAFLHRFGGVPLGVEHLGELFVELGVVPACFTPSVRMACASATRPRNSSTIARST